jgi:DMSO/TMAO reductase YedYZ molybdopterin-dependent catalytic subunit
MAARRAPIVGRHTAEELALAARNRGMPLEALRYDVTPAGLHYLLIHFDIPDAAGWQLEVGGRVEKPFSIGLAELKSLPATTLCVTLECAGNGRAQMSPRYPSVPWLEEGVSTAQWTGVPLAALLGRARLREGVRDIVFRGADRGFDAGVEHAFARSLAPAQALAEDVLLAYEMNGAPLPPQHGAPLRLVVPRWYGMASVKWLRSIEALEQPFDGPQQARSYHFRSVPGEQGTPCTLMRVNSLMVPPGIPDFYSRRRVLDAGVVEIVGRAWSGAAPVTRVAFGVDGQWAAGTLETPASPYAWAGWRATWRAAEGAHELSCRATDAAGATQPLEPPWDLSGFGNNAVQRVQVNVRPAGALIGQIRHGSIPSQERTR